MADGCSLISRQAGHRLVEQQELWFLSQRQSDLKPSFLAIGKFRDLALPQLIKADLAQRPPGLLARFSLRRLGSPRTWCGWRS